MTKTALQRLVTDVSLISHSFMALRKLLCFFSACVLFFWPLKKLWLIFAYRDFSPFAQRNTEKCSKNASQTIYRAGLEEWIICSETVQLFRSDLLFQQMGYWLTAIITRMFHLLFVVCWKEIAERILKTTKILNSVSQLFNAVVCHCTRFVTLQKFSQVIPPVMHLITSLCLCFPSKWFKFVVTSPQTSTDLSAFAAL